MDPNVFTLIPLIKTLPIATSSIPRHLKTVFGTQLDNCNTTHKSKRVYIKIKERIHKYFLNLL